MDATVAAAFALGVLEPWMSGIGGVGGALVYDARSGRVTAVDFGGQSPIALDPDDFELIGEANSLSGWPSVKNGRNAVGPHAFVVPSAPAGLDCLHRMFGCKRWRDLVSPSIRLAEDGITVDWYTTLIIATAFGDLIKDPEARARFLPSDAPPVPALATAAKAVVRLPMPRLARSLETLAAEGAEAMYQGALGRNISEDIQAMNGYLSAGDLSTYEVKVGPSLETPFRDRTIHVLPELNGGPTLSVAFAELNRRMRESGEGPGIESVRAYAAAMMMGWRQRLESMGDAGDRSTPTSTTHLNVIDRAGNIVSLTTTLLSQFGSRVVLPRSGILMNNGINWFDPRPGRTNSLAPDRRVLANYAPAIMTGSGQVIGAGASGGRKIISAVFQILAMCADFKFDPARVLQEPRIDVSGVDCVVADRRLPNSIVDALAESHDVVLAEPVVYPNPYAYANVVRRVGTLNEGACDPEQPWPEAVSEEEV